MRPTDKILRRKDWQTRKDVKGRVDSVVRIIDADDGGIGREARDDGVHDCASRLAGTGTMAIHRIR